MKVSSVFGLYQSCASGNPSTGKVCTGIAEGLAGVFSVSVLCGQPSYVKPRVKALLKRFEMAYKFTGVGQRHLIKIGSS